MAAATSACRDRGPSGRNDRQSAPGRLRAAESVSLCSGVPAEHRHVAANLCLPPPHRTCRPSHAIDRCDTLRYRLRMRVRGSIASQSKVCRGAWKRSSGLEERTRLAGNQASRSAIRANSTAEPASILRMTWPRWSLTVASVIARSAAICLFCNPCTTSDMI